MPELREQRLSMQQWLEGEIFMLARENLTRHKLSHGSGGPQATAVGGYPIFLQ
jgi:hypothetical protein